MDDDLRMKITASGYLPSGESYAVSELGTPPEAISTTLPTINAATGGGIWPGAVWAIVGARGQGATNISLQIALEAVSAGKEALVVNDHVHAAALGQRVRAMLRQADGATSIEEANRLSPRFASWVPDPTTSDTGGYAWNMFNIDPSLIVLDTITDADGPPSPWRDSAAHLERLRHWRGWARQTGRSILTTVRLPDTASGRSPSQDAWKKHVARQGVVETCDVVLWLESRRNEDERRTHLNVLASRIGPTAQIEIHQNHKDLRTREVLTMRR